MTMKTLQIRATKDQIAAMDRMVRKGIYPNRSEAVRDAIRKHIEEKVKS